ncbi:hypothetical protein ACFSKU_20545 [Pontibacter silvestris]|uniref:T9SS C-terminal target domain-containing protein n=1 Tax=Pontibacter silvestris TaxID=2305183 RepID=A0ABW4X3Y0_9BACT|nr:hypothetical protein [Pontibacter silvestris]MCC9137094.1 hypothetical protein [Pontibacter silvestris]
MKRTSRFLLALMLTGSVLSFSSCSDDDDNGTDIDEQTGEEIVVTASTAGTGNVTWTADNTYILDGFVFVNEGQTLTIEPGTVIKGRPGTGENSSALIVARGGKIMANGTADKPIIFTTEEDDVNDPNDIPATQNGLWGGVIILGNATTNRGSGGVGAIEGIPTEDTRGQYGGTNDADNSGVFKYVSIRHAGTAIASDNEINGLTMGAVGSGTTIEYVEVFANQDDGFEWFGGTVNTKYLVSAFCGDDMFDYDEGWRGNNQFWFGIYVENDGGTGGEHDGGTDPEDGQPYAMPVISNATYIGSGASRTTTGTLVIRDNAGGKYYNSIFMDFAQGITIEDLASGEDSRTRLEAGQIDFQNNIFWNVSDNTFNGIGTVGTTTEPWTVALLSDAAKNNRIINPNLSGISRTANGGLNPVPATGSSALSGGAAPSGSFFQSTDYVGAFGTTNWLKGWTYLDQRGYLD